MTLKSLYPITNLIADLTGNGSHSLSITNHLKDEFPSTIVVRNTVPVYNPNEIYLFVTQSPLYYSKRNVETILSGVHIIRPQYFKHGFPWLASNGFSVYQSYDRYNYFLPMMYCNRDIKVKQSVRPIVGIYDTPYRHTLEEFKEVLDSIKQPFDLVTLGLNRIQISNRFCMSKINVIDKQLFFGMISHFLYIKSKTFIDPWPTTLEEAVIYNKQIAIFENDRSFKDGVDDVCSCIKYHKNTFDFEKDLNNDDSVLKHINPRAFYVKLFEQEFKYSIDRLKYKTFEEYLINEFDKL